MRLTLLAVALAVPLGSAVAAPTVVTDQNHWSQGRFEIGPRITYMGLTDVETEQSLPMGGVGGYIRYRLGRRLGLETSLDVLVSDELGDLAPGEVMRVSTPVTLSAMFYLFPESRTQLYLLAGIGAAQHSVQYEALGETLNFGTPIGQLGIGLQYRADDIRFDLSLRSLMMERMGDSVERSPVAGTELSPVSYVPLEGDRTLSGAMFNFGVHWGL